MSCEENECDCDSTHKTYAKVAAGLGCIALAFFGYEHHYDSSGWLVFLGVLILLDLT